MKKQLLALVIAFSAYSYETSAQQSNGTTVTVFEPFKTTVDSVVAKTYNSCVKWNWSLIPRGDFHFSYERRLNDYFSVEPGIGVTYLDYMYELVSDESEQFSSSNTVNPGLSWELGAKLYPGEMDAFEGFYTTLGVRSRSYNAYDEDDKFVGYHFFEPFFMVGFQTETYWDDVMNDFYIGLSYNMLTYTKKEYDRDDVFGYPVYDYIEKKSSFPFIMMGTKLGFSF